MYKFVFLYPNEPESVFTLPLAPEEFKTKVGNKNKTIELVNLGEVNLIKAIALRTFGFKILLPADDSLCDDKSIYKEPLFFLNKFREFKLDKRVVNLLIQRTQPDGISEIFAGNVLVTLEDYNVTESAGSEGSFDVELNFKEYRSIKLIKLNENPDGTVSQEEQRTTKPTAKTYTVKSGDSLWGIAKLQLNDGARYKEIAELNGISDYNNLQAGTVLKLP